MARTKINYEENRLKLIRIAFGLFMEKGYENTTINDILKKANISKGAMYHYFTSKEDILDAVLNYLVDIDSAAFQPVLDDTSLTAWQKLIILIGRNGRDNPEEVTQALEHVSNRPDSIFDYRAQEISILRSVPGIAQIIREGVATGEFHTQYPEEVAEMIISIPKSINTWMGQSPSEEKLQREIHYFVFLVQQSLGLNSQQSEEFYEAIIGQL